MTLSSVSYIAAAVLFAVLAATARRLSLATAEGLGAATGVFLLAFLLALAYWLVRRRWNAKASLPRAMFWWSLAVFALSGARGTP